MRKIQVLIIALLSCFVVNAQTPVQVTPQLLPPYSLQVSEYYSGIQPKLQVLLLNRDINQPTIQVKLKLTIESQNCRMQTKVNANTPIFTLTSGIPYYMTPQDLQPFFTASNIDFGGGYSEQEYVQTGRLPEGLYSFYIEAFELLSGNLVSNKGFTLGWLTLADPPILNTPAKAESVSPTNPQNVIFNWTPRHNTSPTAGYLTDYIFTLVEYNDINIGPEASFTSSPPFFIDSTQTTTFLFGPGQPQLIAGKRYAWRVQAKAKNGSQEIAMFRNNGFSEVFWFTYQNNCLAPLGINHTVQGQRATIEWSNNPQHMEWKVEYREKNNPDAQWFTIGNTLPRVMLTDLKPGTQYEYRVGGSCIVGQFTYSGLYSFTTGGSPVPPVPNCGDSTLPAQGSGQLLQTLNAGDTIRAGSFTVNVGFSTGAGSFTGMGYVIVPWLMNAKVEVRFTNITLSLDHKLLSGIIETTYDPAESGIDDIDEYIDVFTAGYGVGGVVTGQVSADTTVGYPILWPGGIVATLPPGYNPATGQPAAGTTIPITITNAQTGVQTTLQVDQLPTTIMDANGNVYQVSTSGSVSLVATTGGTELLQNMNKKVIDGDKALVIFGQTENAKYAFDKWQPIYKKSSTFSKEYEKIACVNGGLSIDAGNYYVSAKAMAPGATDTLIAVIRKPAGSTISNDSIQFVNSKGTKYMKIVINDSTLAIPIVGGPEKDAQEIYAVYKQTGAKTLNLGKLLVASYPRKEYKVKLVPVNGATVNEVLIAEKLNKVYNKLNIYWGVSTDNNFTDLTWDVNNNGLDITGSGTFSNLTTEMKALNNLYKNSHYLDPTTSYIFILNNANESNVAGDMPRARQFGYVFINGNPNPSLTVLHEVGHGIFRLRHTFDGYGFGQTDLADNLMNYSNGETLTKLQWDYLHDPAIVLTPLESDADGESLVVNNIGSKFLNPDKKTYTFYGPNGTFITLPSHTFNHMFAYGVGSFSWYKMPTGCLTGFSANINGTTKHYELVFKDNDLIGYFRRKYENEPAPDSLFKVGYVDSVVLGVAYSNKYCIIKVRAAGLQNFSSTASKAFVFEPNYTFTPFTGPVNSNNLLAFSYSSNPQIINGGVQSINEDDIQLIAPHEEKPYMLIVEKIIQLKTLYPKIFRIFSKYFDDWNNTAFVNSNLINFLSTIVIGSGTTLTEWDRKVKTTPSLFAKWQSDTSQKRQFYTECLNDLVAFIQAFQNEKATIINQMTRDNPINEELLVSLLQLCSDDDLTGIFAEKRLLAISILASNSAVFDQYFEREIIRLIETTPDGQVDEVTMGLRGRNLYYTNKYLLKQLIYVNDDSFLGFGDDNYKNLIIAVSKVVNRSIIFRQKTNEVTLDNFMNYYVDFSYKTIWRRLWNNGAGIPYTKSSASMSYQDTTIKVDFTNDFVYKWLSLYSVNQNFDVFQPVWLASNKSLTMLNDFSSDVTGAMVPALVLKYLDDKGDMKTTADVINALVDAASIASGYGAIVKGITGIRRALVIVDMAGSGFSLADNISGGYISSNYPLATAIMNGITIFTSAIQMGKWGNQLPSINQTSKISDIYNATKNLTGEASRMPTLTEAKKLCDDIVAAGNKVLPEGITELEIVAKSDLAIAKKLIERMETEAKALGDADLASKAEKALEKLRDVKFLTLSQTAIDNAKLFIANAIGSQTTKFVEDLETVKAVANFLDPVNSNALQALGGQSELTRIIASNSDMPCIKCGISAGHSVFAGRRMDQMLGDLMDFCNRFSSKPDFINAIKSNAQLGHSTAWMREGTQHLLSTIRQNPEVFNATTINRMDQVFEEVPSLTTPCTTCRFDLEMNVPNPNPNGIAKFYELKSYKLESVIGISINQFKSYLSQITDWKQFRYIFNRAKTADLDLVKKEFQKVFMNNATDIWNANQNLMKKFKIGNNFVEDIDDFKDLVKRTDFWNQLEFISFE
jgi:hypothetical protein